MPEIKRTIKDSVFTYLFSQPEYARELYLNLHPEDQDVTEEDIKLITLENVLTTGQYNDLGLQVRDKLILLMEAQSTFSPNIPLRLLMYLADTYREYVLEEKISLYSDKKAIIPRPELYVVYTGGHKNVPDVMRLSDMHEGAGSAEIEVKVLRGENPQQILGQYVAFCKISNEQVAMHGRTDVAASETIRICLEQKVLTLFLSERQKEVRNIMRTLFDQETIMEIERYNIQKESRREGLREGRQEGIEKGIAALVNELQEFVDDKTAVAQALKRRFDIPLEAAMEKVQQYWKN